MHFTREEFKRMAAGTYVLGKSSYDSKMLEAYVDGAMMYWDYQVTAKAKAKVDAGVGTLIKEPEEAADVVDTREN